MTRGMGESDPDLDLVRALRAGDVVALRALMVEAALWVGDPPRSMPASLCGL